MKINWKHLLLLVGIVLLDFVLVLMMRLITPKIFLLRLIIIIVIISGSILCYYFIVKPENLVKESIFVSLTLMILTLILTVILHKFIENNLSIKNFIVPLLASIVPFISGGLYKAAEGKHPGDID